MASTSRSFWYGNFFMRVTQAISRAQELAADRLSAQVAGAKNAASALIAVEGAAAAHQSYWDSRSSSAAIVHRSLSVRTIHLRRDDQQRRVEDRR